MTIADLLRGELKYNHPVDILISGDREEDFSEHLRVISGESVIREKHAYRIYENESNTINQYLYQNVDNAWVQLNTYFNYDTYILLSDYNAFRAMAGYAEAELEAGRFLFHCKTRIKPYLETLSQSHTLMINGNELTHQETLTDPLRQQGLNGADYLVVVPDDMLPYLRPYFALLAVNIDGKVPDDLTARLQDLSLRHKGAEGEEGSIHYGSGTFTLVDYTGPVMVRDNMIATWGFNLVSITFVLAYIGFIFLCTALTVLAVQQLSDAEKFKSRYTVLHQLGLNRKDIARVVLKQLGLYYLCPLVLSVVLSLFFGTLASEVLMSLTGVQTWFFQYYLLAFLVFLALYMSHFLITYIGFQRKIFSD